MDDLDKQYDNSSRLYQASSIILKASVNSNWKPGNTQFRTKLVIVLCRVTLKFDEWPWKSIGHLFYATSNFVHHFIAIGRFKLELQSGNAKVG